MVYYARGRGEYLAILVIADPWRGLTVPPILDTPDTHNPRVNSTADAVLQLDMQFREGVFGVDTGFTDITNRRGFNHVAFAQVSPSDNPKAMGGKGGYLGDERSRWDTYGR